MAGKKGMKHYSQEIKLLAVQLCLQQGKTHQEAADELDLPRAELVEQWVHRYRLEGVAGFNKPIGRPRKSPLTPSAYIAQLEMQVILLKKYHTELRKTLLARRDIGSSNITEEPIR